MKTQGMLVWWSSLAVTCAALPTHLQAAPRTWTNQEGKTIEAELMRVEGDKVRLQLTGGKVYDVPVATLSAADQEFIKAEQDRTPSPGAPAADLSKRRAKWTEDWEEALAESKSSGLPILLLMTGSDWCGYCMQLEKNVFEDRAFERFANEHLVLMKADFPHNTSQKKAVKEQNAKLKETYPFNGYPTVILLDPELKELDRLVGYGGDEAGAYVEKVQAKLPSKK